MEGKLRLSCGFERLRVVCGIGVYDEEKLREQELFISLRLHYPAARARRLADEDDCRHAYDYAQAAGLVESVCASAHHELIEHLAQRIFQNLRRAFPDLVGLDLRIGKPGALPAAEESRTDLEWRL